MKKLKTLLKTVLGSKLYNNILYRYINILGVKALFRNTYEDGKLFYKHSMVFKQNTFNKIESSIILHYHAIEKGFLHNDFRYRFGKDRIIALIKLLSMDEVKQNSHRTQIAIAYLAMCRYYERHESNHIDISDFYSKHDYALFKKITFLDVNIVFNKKSSSYFENVNGDFKDFSNSRSSVRNFTDEKIPISTIKQVIELAKNAPSVCNRQPSKVYYLENKATIDRVLKIQGGLSGYTKEINQLLIVVTDRNYFYTIGERNQLYIDGGIFLMNLLYALHYYKIAACPANWGHPYEKDKQILKELPLLESEKVICIVPIGFPSENFKTTLSLRRESDEILKIINI